MRALVLLGPSGAVGTFASGYRQCASGSAAAMSGADVEPDEAVFTRLQEHGDFFFDTVGGSVVFD